MSDHDGRRDTGPGGQVHSKNGERSPKGGQGQVEGYPGEWDGISNGGEISSTNVMSDTASTGQPPGETRSPKGGPTI